MDFYLAENGQQVGPLSVEQLRAKGIARETLVWREGMAQWTPAGSVGELASIFSDPAASAGPTYTTPPASTPYANYGPSYGAPPYSNPQMPPGGADKKVAAGLCGILIGGLGIHKFILGYSGAGLTMLLVTVVGGIFTCGISSMAMGIIGLIEGIIYLTKSDQDFYREYVLQQKTWF